MYITGKHAYVNGVPCTTSWGANIANSASVYEASCVPDGSGAVEGNLDLTGAMSGMGYLPPIPGLGLTVLTPYEALDFIGVVDGRDTPYKLSYTGDVLLAETVIQIPVNAGTPIVWQSTFGVQGVFGRDVTNTYTDPPPYGAAPSAKWGKVLLATQAAPTTFTPVNGVQNITITFRREQTTFVQDGLTYRAQGDLLAEVSFEVNNRDVLQPVTDPADGTMTYADALIPNSVMIARINVTNSLFFEFDALLIKDKTNFVVSRIDKKVLGYTVNCLWTAVRSGVTVLGYIKKPGGAFIYPTPVTLMTATTDKTGKAKADKSAA